MDKMICENEYKGILIIAEMEGDHIHRVAFELLYKGRQLAEAAGESLSCLLLTGCETDASELCLKGAEQVYVMEDACFAQPEERLFAENIVSFIRERRPATILIGATHLGRSLAPRMAAALETGLTADCTELKIADDGALEQIRPAFSDNILAHIKTMNRPQMATVRYKEFQEATLCGGAEIRIEKIQPYVKEHKGVKIEEIISTCDVDITDAEVVVAGGRGIRKEEDLQLLQELADVLGGKLGVSRALVDAGMAASSIQVGYSGNRVKPKVYIACGISGAPQHIAGMKDADLIIAVNNDPSAPIFNISDYGFVGDLYEIEPKLTEAFAAKADRKDR